MNEHCTPSGNGRAPAIDQARSGPSSASRLRHAAALAADSARLSACRANDVRIAPPEPERHRRTDPSGRSDTSARRSPPVATTRGGLMASISFDHAHDHAVVLFVR